VKETPIARIIEYKWVNKVGKYIVKLGFIDERAKSVWMTRRQLAQLEAQFSRTPKGHSTQRCEVVGLWHDSGRYGYARLDRRDFIPPDQYNLADLRDDT
jgi:hypothetical protein